MEGYAPGNGESEQSRLSLVLCPPAVLDYGFRNSLLLSLQFQACAMELTFDLPGRVPRDVDDRQYPFAIALKQVV